MISLTSNNGFTPSVPVLKPGILTLTHWLRPSVLTPTEDKGVVPDLNMKASKVSPLGRIYVKDFC